MCTYLYMCETLFAYVQGILFDTILLEFDAIPATSIYAIVTVNFQS